MAVHRIPLRVPFRIPLLLVVDSLLISAAFIAAFWLGQLLLVGRISPYPWSVQSLLVISLLWLYSAFLSGCYDTYRASDARAGINRVIGAASLTALVYVFLAEVVRIPLRGHSHWMVFWILSMLVLSAWRFLYASVFEKPLRRVLILGTGWAARELARTIEERPDSGYELVGFIDDDPAKQVSLIDEVPVLGDSGSLATLIQEHEITDMIWATSDNDTDKYDMLVSRMRIARDLRAQVIPVSVAYEQLTGRVLVNPISGTWYGMPSLEQRSLGLEVFWILKRLLDVVAASIGLFYLSLINPFIAAAIYLDNPGPVFVMQDYLGRHGRRFRGYKYRTVVSIGASTDASVWPEDARLTRVGELLRRTGLEELPKILNVLRGEMSLVGPTADSLWFAAEAESLVPLYELRRIVRPGLTGWGLVNYLSGKLPPDPLVRAQYDLYYIKHKSLYLDLIILFRTVVMVLVGPRRLESWALQPDWNKALGRLSYEDPTEFAQSAKAILESLSKALDFSITNSCVVLERFHAFALDTLDLFYGTKLPRVFPVLFLQRRELVEPDLDNLRHVLTDRLKPTTHIALLILFCDHEDLDQARRLLAQKMRQVYAFDIIPLGREDVRRITLARDPRRILRRLVLSQVDLVTVSPFVITGPASDTMFFGRETELREIREQIATANYAVIGGRRIGKTSILKRLERVCLPAAGFHALYHDCSFTPSQAELVQATAADRAWFPEPPASTPASFAGIIQALHDDKPLVILLDEADKLIVPDQAVGYPFFNTLRAMANAGRCRFVLSGEQVLRAELTNPDSPLYNFANEMLVGRLDFRAIGELVTRPMKQLEIELADEAEMVQRIWDFTSGHPNVVQRLCQHFIVRLNQRGDRRLTLDDVEAVVADPSFLRKDFLNVYWERATALERLCSLVMAADDNARTLTAVHDALSIRGLKLTLNQVDDALERLVDLRNVLQRTAEGYAFAVTAFPEVIAKTARLDDLIALNREAFRRHGNVEPRSKRGAP